MIVFDFEVFKYDWLVVMLDIFNKKEHVIVNDKIQLENLYLANKKNIWMGYNSTKYDRYILQGILCDFNPKEINDFIIVDGKQGWEFSSLLNSFPLNCYDVKKPLDPSLKMFEGFMGNSIKETSVSFDIDRKLTSDEINEVIKYCKHDVYQTLEVFKRRKTEFDTHLSLVKLCYPFINLRLMSKTKAQLTSIILDARKREYNDEFVIDFPKTMKINKYTEIPKWYSENKTYGTKLKIDIAGVPHVLGWGGIHGAIPKYHDEGEFVIMDVASQYPSLMINYNLMSRSMRNPDKFIEIYHQRLKYKKDGNPLQQPLKIVLNSAYGVMKDEFNSLYDPLQANRVCIYGQLLIVDLIERLESYCKLIQSNTDGILIKLTNHSLDTIKEIAKEWEIRTKLNLEFDSFKKVFQKDVNNYLLVKSDGSYKSNGGWVKKLDPLDNNLPIVKKALVNYMVNNVPLKKTIFECNNLLDFQQVCRITSKYKYIMHGDKILKERCIRVFASKRSEDKGVFKIHAERNNLNKISDTPTSCFIDNGNVLNTPVPPYLDKTWYLELAERRLEAFGY